MPAPHGVSFFIYEFGATADEAVQRAVAAARSRDLGRGTPAGTIATTDEYVVIPHELRDGRPAGYFAALVLQADDHGIGSVDGPLGVIRAHPDSTIAQRVRRRADRSIADDEACWLLFGVGPGGG